MKKLVPLLLILAMCIVGCDMVGLSVTTTTEPPVISSFQADPATIAVGASSTLEWKVSGATKVSIDPGIGSVALEGSRAVMPGETIVYTLTAANASGTTATATAQVIVTGAAPPPASLPVVTSFTASPPNISTGDSATLSWNVSNATSVVINPGLGTFATSGSTIVVPAATTTYILTAANADGSTTASAQVTVSSVPSPPAGLPAINAFNASPPVIPGTSGSTFLRWNVSDATAVSIVPDIGPVSSSGTMLVTLSSSTEFILTASNAYGVVSRTVSVIVTGGGGPSVAYDFVEQAPTAYWWTIISSSVVVLPFPGATSDKGYANYQYNVKLNDGNTYTRVLQTHPQWVNNGFISGKYSGVYVPPGAKLRIKVGLVQGAAAGNVEFHIGNFGDVATISVGVAYADGVKVMEADLSAYAGQTIDFVLGANANGSSAQDWAAWAEARIIY